MLATVVGGRGAVVAEGVVVGLIWSGAVEWSSCNRMRSRCSIGSGAVEWSSCIRMRSSCRIGSCVVEWSRCSIGEW